MVRCEGCGFHTNGDPVMIESGEVSDHLVFHARWCFSYTEHAGHGVCDGYPRRRRD